MTDDTRHNLNHSYSMKGTSLTICTYEFTGHFLSSFSYIGSGLKKLTRWVGYWTHHPSALSFARFPSSDAPPPAPLSLTRYPHWVYVSIWCDSPAVASTGSNFKRCEIVCFVSSMSGGNWRMHRSIITQKNDNISKMKWLLDLICTGVRLCGVDSTKPVSAS